MNMTIGHSTRASAGAGAGPRIGIDDRRHPSPWLRAAGVAGLLLAGGCATQASLAPTKADEAVAFKAFRHAAQAGDAFDAAWWRRFGDPRLVELVEQAQRANLDVRLAIERVTEARTGATAAASRMLPTLGATASASDTRSGLPDVVKSRLPDVRALRGALEASWEVDLFGAARAGAQAAALDAESAGFGVEAARLLVGAEVASQYFAWQGARARLERIEALVRAQADTERLVGNREAAGHASRFDVARAAAETRVLSSQRAALQALVLVTEHRLSVLVGASPTAPLRPLHDAGAAHLLEVPVLATGQPAELLARRPDVRAAQMQLAAESARLRESRADLLPKFFLSALFGSQDLRLNGIDLSPVRYSNVGLLFALPIFNAGRLQAAVERQSSRERAAALRYEQAVLGAVRDVESSLVALAQEHERLAELRQAEAQRRVALEHARSLHREGAIDLLQLLDAQRGVIAAELATLDSRTQQLSNAVLLFKALGGGWEVRS